MLQLVLIYCLQATPQRCVEDRPALALFSVPIACLLAGQQAAAPWLAMHPKYILKDVRCERPESGVPL